MRFQRILNFIIILFTAQQITAQIPINGFAKYSTINFKGDYNNIFHIDYNADGYRDLILFNSNSAKYLVVENNKNSSLKVRRERNSAAPISLLHFTKNNSEGGVKYLALSKTKKTVELAEFSSDGAIRVRNKYKFNGNPSFADAADIERDGRMEYLVGGRNINGLYIFKETSKGLREEVYADSGVYSSGYFVDLDSDGFVDIVAFDPLANEIVILSNDLSGGFTEERSVEFIDGIKNFRVADFNSDGFNDLVYIKRNGIEAILGDSVYSFKKKSFIETHSKPEKFEIDDFNRDGYNDIAFITADKKNLYIKYRKSVSSYHKPIKYLQKKGLIDLTSFVDRSGKKIAVLDSLGSIHMLGELEFGEDKFSTSLIINAKTISEFDYLNDKFLDYAIYDETKQSLNVILNERRNLFKHWYEISLSAEINEIHVNDTSPGKKTFFCYNKGQRFIEIVRFDFEKQSHQTRIIYAEGDILSMRISTDKQKDRQSIFVLIKKNGILSLQTIEFKEFRYVKSDEVFISDNFIDADFTLSDFKEVLYLSKKNNGYSLSRVVLNRTPAVEQLSFYSKEEMENIVKLGWLPPANNKTKVPFSILSAKDGIRFDLFREKRKRTFLLRDNSVNVNSTLSGISYSWSEPAIYFSSANKIVEIRIDEKLKQISEKTIFEMPYQAYFYISKKRNRNNFILYGNPGNQTLNFMKY